MKSGSSPVVFNDTCGQFLNRYSLEPLIKCVSDELGVHPATIMTQSQLDQAIAYLFENAESDDAVSAISARIREACEMVASSVEASLNPFAGAAFSNLFFRLLEGQSLPREKLDHLNSLVRTSYADEFKTTGSFQDACGVPIEGNFVHCHYAAVVCQELNIAPELIKTKSQLDKALRYLLHSTTDAEAVAALNAKFDDIEMKAFDNFIARQGLNGLPQEALSTIYASFKQGKPMTTDQLELVRNAMIARIESQADQ